MITNFLRLMVNLIGRTFMTNLMEKDKDLHVDNKYDVHMSSMIYVDNGYGVDLDLLN